MNLDLIGGTAAAWAGATAGLKAFLVLRGLGTGEDPWTFWLVVSLFFLNQAAYSLLKGVGIFSDVYAIVTIIWNVASSAWLVAELVRTHRR